MKPTLCIIASSLLFFSCTQFQYLTVSGINVTKDSSNSLISENDTVRIKYQFTDYQGKIEITVFNKTAQPLEVEWRKSALVLDGKTYSYYNPNASFSGTFENDTLARRTRTSVNYMAGINGNIEVDQASEFIPPNASIKKYLQPFFNERLKNLPEKDAVKESVTSVDYETISYKRLLFEKEKSPLTFRSYLTLQIGSGSQVKEFAVEHEFYVSEVWQSSLGPQNFPTQLLSRGDRFYMLP